LLSEYEINPEFINVLAHFPEKNTTNLFQIFLRIHTGCRAVLRHMHRD
jgi:hypothetical protein